LQGIIKEVLKMVWYGITVVMLGLMAIAKDEFKR